MKICSSFLGLLHAHGWTSGVMLLDVESRKKQTGRQIKYIPRAPQIVLVDPIKFVPPALIHKSMLLGLTAAFLAVTVTSSVPSSAVNVRNEASVLNTVGQKLLCSYG
jgi:hypothetical protein